jgi:hypothetical protein
MACDECAAVSLDNLALHERVRELENQLNFLTRHQTLARGLAGERLIAEAVSGLLTSHTASVDVELPDGQTIEVKQAKISSGNRRNNSGRRWQWQKVFGQTNQKQFDWLLLVGDADPLFASHYRDPTAPFVLFCVPFDRVQPLTTAGTNGARGINISTNPNHARGTSAALYTDYQVTMAEVEERFGTMA